MFSRVLVANRGEIAVRVIRALHELGVEAVAVYSTADRDALHVRLADQAVCIGPPPAAESYLRIPNVDRRRRDDRLRGRPSRASASSPRTPPSCGRAPTTTSSSSGPPADVMEKMGDKARAKAEMRAAGVPLVPGHRGRGDARRGARPRPPSSAIPVLLKAAAGGGGKGMRLVARAGRARGRLRRPRAPRPRRRSATGRSTSRRRSCPRGTSRSRCSATTQGGVLTLGERECSIQRRHQKLIEESPSPALTPETREAMEAAAERACRAARLRERRHVRVPARPRRAFLVHRGERRLQVEHPVTELSTGHRPRARAAADRRRRAARR